MFAIAGGPSFASSPLTWNLLFARQPEPDLEFTEEELEQTTNLRSPAPMKSPKKSGGRPLLWILILALVGGGAYVAMEPEMLMDYLGPLLGESPAPPHQPPMAMKPAQPRPAPGVPPNQAGPAGTAPVAPPTPAPMAAPNTPGAPASTSMPPAPMSPPAPVAAAPPVTATPSPLFAEGQRVSLLPNPAAPTDTVPLMQDAEGTRPGPAIPPGTMLTILDGDLQGNGWVYSVRSDYGTKGWVAEKQLRLRP